MDNQEQASARKPISLEPLIPPVHNITSYALSMLSQQAGFVGRESELAKIETLFNDPSCRLLTLVGLGGVGKTRMACEAAARATRSFAHGSYFVALAPISSPNLVASTIAAAIGLFLIGAESPRTQLINYLRGRELLLVIDNFEHLMSASALLVDILQATSGVRMLVTSIERLNVREEWVLDVDGLDYPLTEVAKPISDYSAIQFFVKCASRVKADFQLTAANQPNIIRICQLVEGLPLGIELAAAWVRALSCKEIADEIERNLDFLTTSLRNTPDKHRSMRVVFEHSYALLTPEQQQVFKKLSVFRGGFRREAAEVVIHASLTTLAALVDKSLLRVSIDGLYTMHELLRQYGSEQMSLSAVELDAIRDRHCDYYTAFLAGCWPRLKGSDVKSALTEIETELENVRAAWDWAVQKHKADRIEAALNSLWVFYGDRALYQEGEQAFAKAAAIFDGDMPDEIKMRAKIQVRQGALCENAGLPDKANALLRASVNSLRQHSAPYELALALHRLAIVLLDSQLAFDEAAAYLHESLALFTELGDHWNRGNVLNWLSIFYHKQSAEQGVENALERAQYYAQECLAVSQQLDSTLSIAAAYMNLADVAYLRGEYEPCWRYAEKSLALFQELGVFWGISVALCLMGQAACALTDYDAARRCVLQALAAEAEYRLTSVNHFSLHHLALAAQIWLYDGELEAAYTLLAMIDGQFLKLHLSRRQHGAFATLDRLHDTLPLHLTAAVERGKAGDIRSAAHTVMTDFKRSLGQGKALSPLSSPEALLDTLTKRELEVLRLLARGLSNSTIAQTLIISVGTVKAHTSSIYGKLGVDKRIQAIAKATKLGLL